MQLGHIALYTLILFFHNCTFAATPVDKNTLQLTAAKELIQLESIDKKIDEVIDETAASLEMTPRSVDPQFTYQMHVAAKIKFDQKRLEIRNHVTEKMAAYFAKNFSLSELNYLIMLAKNPLNKKFKALLKATEFSQVFEYPSEQSLLFLKEARNTIKPK